MLAGGATNDIDLVRVTAALLLLLLLLRPLEGVAFLEPLYRGKVAKPA